MDQFSFLNAANTAYFAELYDQYLQFPDSVEPSWRAFFQGFDFGKSSHGEETESTPQPNNTSSHQAVDIPENVFKEFRVVQLIDGYRSRGHLFTKTNPVRERRKYEPTLAIENFGLSKEDLETKFSAGEILKLGKATLKEIINHLDRIYCHSIGIEYMYLKSPKEIKWIQERLNINENHPKFSKEEKIQILKKLNEAVSFETFLHTKYVGQKRFSLEGGEALFLVSMP